MAIASFILGVVTLVFSFIPFLSSIVCPITGLLTIIFGIIDLCKNNEHSKKFSKVTLAIIFALVSTWITFLSSILASVLFRVSDIQDKYTYTNKYTYNNKYNTQNNKLNNSYKYSVKK